MYVQTMLTLKMTQERVLRHYLQHDMSAYKDVVLEENVAETEQDSNDENGPTAHSDANAADH